MTSWARSWAPSLVIARLTCVLAVATLTNRSRAISSLLRPRSTVQAASFSALKNSERPPPAMTQPVSSVWPKIGPAMGSDAPVRAAQPTRPKSK